MCTKCSDDCQEGCAIEGVLPACQVICQRWRWDKIDEATAEHSTRVQSARNVL